MPMTVEQIRDLLDDADESEFKALERALQADTRKGVISHLKKTRKRLDAQRKERERIEALYDFEHSFLDGDGLIVGLDEVGRGSVAGPLAVGAVVLGNESRIMGLNDSKKLSPAQRSAIAQTIKAEAIAWSVFYVQPHEIDRDGMSASLRKAFSGALKDVEDAVDDIRVVLIDGNPLGIDARERNVIKGDSKCASIAAASIVAKAERDALMVSIAEQYPTYQFDVNKGYASPQHIDAIRSEGLSDMHRASFCRSFMQETLF